MHFQTSELSDRIENSDIWLTMSVVKRQNMPTIISDYSDNCKDDK